MSKKKTDELPTFNSEPIKITDVSGNLPNIHYELGTGTTPDGEHLRFLMHVNHACLWLEVGDKRMFQVMTQDIMSAVEAAVLARLDQEKGGA